MDFDPITKAVLAIVCSYLVGSIPMGLIVARIARGIDIREYGSGNIGLTNVIRTIGWGPGLVTGVLDFLKGFLPVFFTMQYFDPANFANVNAVYEMIIILVAAVIIIGNLYPVYLLFRGGKGVATGLGVMSALLGPFIFVPIAVFGLILLIFRFVSAASMIAAVAVPVTALIFSNKIPYVLKTPESETAIIMLSVFTWVTAILIIWRHRANVVRIVKGTEPRVGKPGEPSLPTQKKPVDDSQKKATRPVKSYVGTTCVYCSEKITVDDEVIECSTCDAVYHADCWRKNSGCVTENCPGTPVHISPSGTEPEKGEESK